MPNPNMSPQKGAGSAHRTASAGKPVKKNLRKKKRIGALVALGITAFLIIAVVLVGIHLVNSFVDEKLGLLNIQTDTHETEEVFATAPLTEIEVPETVEEDIHGQLNEANLPLICDTKDVKNILLLATDARWNEAGLSDSMILVSINQKTKKIVLCSFMRDLLVKIPQEPHSSAAGNWEKLTHAHAYGGPHLTMATLKENYNIQVDYYAKINFYSFVELVDAMGGLDMELTADEIWFINDFMYDEEMVQIFSYYPKKQVENRAGLHKLDGLQALCHARNRRIGSDWARTQRQRLIIAQMAKQAKELPLAQLNNLLDTALPMITTNMPAELLKGMVWDSIGYFQYEFVNTRMPLDGTFTEVRYNIVPDLEKNCTDLYEKIYGEPAPKAQ
ncbi:MAG: LCP family protein [Clostridia bacterium]|nr:LCP family protein [Clostridia bacterium]